MVRVKTVNVDLDGRSSNRVGAEGLKPPTLLVVRSFKNCRTMAASGRSWRTSRDFSVSRLPAVSPAFTVDAASFVAGGSPSQRVS
jgi:hypothetical protein